MPPSVITIETDHDAGAHWYDNLKIEWTATNAASVSMAFDGGLKNYNFSPSYPSMPNRDCEIVVNVVGLDGFAYTASKTIPLLPAVPVKPTPFPSPLTPADDPIVSVVVTYKSGKQTTLV